jgi:uncharacterized membrane protein YeaQ/YmgE (transglycosylase-associated protein family)
LDVIPGACGEVACGPNQGKQQKVGEELSGERVFGSPDFISNTHTEEDKMINFIVWIVVGGIIGWLASMVMRTNAQQGILLNIIVGIVGAFVAGIVLTPLLGIGTINQNNFSLPALLVSLVGAVILLAVVNLISRGRMR